MKWAQRSNLDLHHFPVLSDLRAAIESAVGRRLHVEFVLASTSTALASVCERGGALYILLRYEALVLAHTDPDLLSAIVWHEIGHCIQWDTKYGYWTIKVLDFLYLPVTLVAVGALLPVSGVMIIRLIQHHLTNQDIHDSLMLLALLPFLFLLIAIVRLMNHALEYCADFLCASAGYDRALARYLARIPPTNPIMQLFRPHPSAKARLAAILRNRTESLTGQGFSIPPLRKRDYLYGFCFYILPLWIAGDVVAVAMMALLVSVRPEIFGLL